MFSRKTILNALSATLVAVASIALGGNRNQLHAEDFRACIIGGTGPLCKTVSVQKCLEWKTVTLGGGVTSVSVGLACERWETTTTYYYYDAGSGGVTIKPGLM